MCEHLKFESAARIGRLTDSEDTKKITGFCAEIGANPHRHEHYQIKNK